MPSHNPKRRAVEKYLVPVTAKTLNILEAFRSPDDELTLQQVIEASGVPHTTAYRILFTLVHRNYLRQNGKKYRLAQARRKTRIGFATLSGKDRIASAVTVGLEEAAKQAGMEIVVLDNRLSPEVAVENARELVRQWVDVAIEFQRFGQVAPLIAEMFAAAGIPTISILTPQPGSIYFGVDNYRAGWTAGLALAEHAALHWGKKFDLVLLLDIPEGGPLIQSRMTGVHQGLDHALGPIAKDRLIRIPGGGDRDESHEATLRVLQERPKIRRILISASSDDGAMGALSAVQEMDRAEGSAIIGHGGFDEVWPLIAKRGSPYVGTIAFFPERYGRGLVDCVVRLLRGEQVPPAIHMPHHLITRRTIAAMSASRTPVP